MRKTERMIDIATYAAFAMAVLFLLWKVQFGFANIDEAFYLTVPMRLWLGDGLFTEEWHLSLMSGPLLYPFMAGYMAIRGGVTDGILLTFRYVFVVVHTAVSVALYYRLRTMDKIGAAVGSLCFLIYAPFGISALSYNSFGIDLLALSCVLYATGENEKKWYTHILSGMLLSGAVLCCPYLVLVYVYFSLAIFYMFVLRKEKRYIQDWLAVSAGVAIAAAAFLILVFSRASVRAVIHSLAPMLADPEHESRTISSICVTYFREIYYSAGLFSRNAFILAFLTFVLAVLDRRKKLSPYLILINLLMTISLLWVYYKRLDYLNFLMFPVNVCACCCYPIAKDRRVCKLFWTVWVPGILYSFCIHCASNQLIYAITSASVTALIGSMPMIFLTLRDVIGSMPKDNFGKKIICFVTVCFVCIQLGTELSIRYKALFWEASMEEQTCRMDFGPQKGIKASQKNGEKYRQAARAVLDSQAYQKADAVLILSENTWLYLLEPKQVASYSAWLSGVNEYTLQRLAIYFQNNPNKKPDCVILAEAYESLRPMVIELIGSNTPVVSIPGA